MTAAEADDSQAVVIEDTAAARQLVTAGPGSGKTWTAAQRLASLARARSEADEDDCGLLALTFSRAAAAAISGALRQASVQNAVEVRTLDSWATTLLRTRWLVDGDYAIEAIESKTYDDRIALALSAISDSTLVVPEVRHVVVDEAQDVYDSRARLVMALLGSSATTGWTVLGDRAQSIFEFDANGTKNLLDLLEDSPLEFSRRELFSCHRTSAKPLLAIRDLGARLRSPEPTNADLAAVREQHLSLKQLSEPEFLATAPGYISRGEYSAVLFRDNRSLLAMSARLSEHGVPHRIASGRAEAVVPSWVASLNASGSAVISEEEVRAAVPDELDADLILEALRITCRRGRGSIDARTIAEAISLRSLPEPVLQEAPSGILLSTAHRAKGLEFLRVFVTPGIWERAGGSAEEARTFYVAMTRATATLLRLQPAEPKRATRPDRIKYPINRLVERSFNKGVVTAIELALPDIDWRAPRHTLPDRVNAFESLGLGDAVVLEQDERSQVPTWKVLDSSGQDLASTTPVFSEVASVVLGNRSPLGSRFAGGRVTGFMTLPLAPGSLEDGRQLVRCPIVRGMISQVE